MILGLQMGMFRNEPWKESIDHFIMLAKECSLNACELHLDGSLYKSAIKIGDKHQADYIVENMRPIVKKLGVHLPFFRLGPVSKNKKLAQASKKILEDSIMFASKINADYVVFHGRQEKSSKKSSYEIWLKMINHLSNLADKKGLIFCLENADDIKDVGEIRKILGKTSNRTKICLDTGHLYEREYSNMGLRRYFYILNDRLFPSPFKLRSGLPIKNYESISEVLELFRKRIGCIHIHNNDGVKSHVPINEGKIDMKTLSKSRDFLKEVPIILEADYRDRSISTIKKDIMLVQEMLS